MVSNAPPAPPAPRKPGPTAATPMAFAQAIVLAYSARGMDPARALEQAQITPAQLHDSAARISSGQLEALSAAAPEVRLRLGSLEPRTVTEDFCRRAAALPNLCPQFHQSMQSGCDATLKRMNRKYDTARFRESVRLLNRYFHRPAITTVSVDRRAIGQRAASLLADRIEQIPREDDIIDVGFHLVERESA